MLKRKVSCTFKREKISLDNQERIYPIRNSPRSRIATLQVAEPSVGDRLHLLCLPQNRTSLPQPCKWEPPRLPC